MKKQALLFIILMAYSFSWFKGIIQAKLTFCTFPMHHQIHEPTPGDCPICGMTLIKEKTK